MQQIRKNQELPPRLSELGTDLLRVTRLQQGFTLGVPFAFAALFFYAGFTGHPIAAILATVFLSFITYGSTSHDLVHRNLGLPRSINEVFLTLIELIALRSGHAYRAAHLYHHARFPADDDIEAAAARKTFFGALLDGTTFHPRLYFWALRRARGIERRVILGEGIAIAAMFLVAIAMVKVSIVPIGYAALMSCGAWITPLVTSYVPHDAHGNTELEQTRLFRGRLSVIDCVRAFISLGASPLSGSAAPELAAISKALGSVFRKATG